MEAYKTYQAKQNYSKGSIKLQVKDVENFQKWLKENRLTEEEIKYRNILEYVKTLQEKNNKPHTINTKLNNLRHYFLYQIKIGKREDNPAYDIIIKGTKKTVLKDLLKEEELEEIYRNYQYHHITDRRHYLATKRNKIMLSLVIYQALDTKALERLKVADIKLREGKIYVPGTKRENSRTLELKAHQILDLQEYILVSRKEMLPKKKTLSSVASSKEEENNQLFISVEGNTKNIKSLMEKFTKRLRIIEPKFKNIRQLRASVINNWLRKEGIRKVQIKVGHKYISSTEKYKTGDLENLQEEINKYHPLA